MSTAENLLGRETSPYLLQHAGNPVHWRPWGAAALAEAAAANGGAGRPILLSIGYAACHWCHVMAHESFEDPATAALMNAHFINIKLDREERPDIDHIYISALQAMGEDGGWPLTMFLTPDGTPFWGGTYFPPEPRWGRPSFRQVLQGVADAWAERDEMVTKNPQMLRAALEGMAAATPGAPITPALLDAAGAILLRATDPVLGGLKGAPKFPNPPIFRFLWQNAWRAGEPAGREATHLLLQRACQGGIYDHLGGGFARYSVDENWLVPHFEKMLYDNAQLLELLALAHADRPHGDQSGALYFLRAAETVGWLDRDMTAATDPAGNAAFAASEDADSEGEEGKFYVWSEAEIDALLGADAAAFKTAYDVSATGNWEGHTILRRVTPFGPPGAEAVLDRCRLALFAARAKRVRPGRDDKVLADWNGLAVAALARAASVFAQPVWLARAASAFDFVYRQMASGDGRVGHAWRLGRVTAAGLLDDQAAMARAALALFEASGDPARLTQAVALAEAAIRYFGDGAGAFFTTASDAADVPLGTAARPRVAADHAAPSGNAMMAEVFARLFHLTGESRWREMAEALPRGFSGKPPSPESALAGMPGLLTAADLLAEGAVVVVTGPAGAAETAALCRVVLAHPDPALCLLRAPDSGDLPAGHPAHGKAMPGAGAAAYVCRGGVCALPVREPSALRAALRRG